MEIEYTQLYQAITAAFTAHGVAADEAQIVAEELADATFAGYESHGIGRVKGYLQMLKEGTLRAGAPLATVRETPAMALLDAGLGFGIAKALKATELAAEKAKECGIGAVSVRNCGDVARLAPYAERVAAGGCIGLVMANDAGAGQVVAPHGGARAVLCTNPIAAGIPRAAGRPIVFDFATSQIALGAARAATRRGAAVQEDTLIGVDGETTADPEALFAGLAALLPLGGLAFGFKGTALALLVEALAGGLSGDGFSGEFPDRNGRNALFLLAIDAGAFVDTAVFHAAFEALLTRLRSTPPRQGVASVRIPGEHGPKAGSGSRVQVLDSLWDELMTLKN